MASGEGGMDGGAPNDALDPVRVIRGDGSEYWDLTIRGEGLDEYDGTRVIVRLGNADRPPERLGSGEAVVEDGTFELVFPAVWETSLYKTKLVLLDVDGDGACNVAVDRLFADSRATKAEELIVALQPSGGGDYFTQPEGTVADYFATWFNREWPVE